MASTHILIYCENLYRKLIIIYLFLRKTQNISLNETQQSRNNILQGKEAMEAEEANSDSRKLPADVQRIGFKRSLVTTSNSESVELKKIKFNFSL